MWRCGRRDIWRGGERIAEVVSSDWSEVAPLIAAAPDLHAALKSMVDAFETARDISVSVRLKNHRAHVDALALLEKLAKQ